MSLLRRLAPRTYMARRNLLRARSRSALAVLTIVIGVVAIATLGSFGATFQAAQSESLGDIGNQVTVSPGDDAGWWLDERTQREVERVAGDADVVPLQRERRQTDPGGETIVYRTETPTVLFDVREGSVPSNWRSGALVGSRFADEHDVGVGDAVTVGDQTHHVRAVLTEQGQISAAQPDDAVVLPMATAEERRVQLLVVATDSSPEATRIANEIRAALNDRQELVNVQDRSRLAEQIDEVFWQINVFLLGIAGISLLVAGISIANVMLMSAMERREEIGVLRAVGYQRRDVLATMLAEAALLGVVGAVVGVTLSVLATAGINSLMLGDPLAYQPQAIRYMALAVAFGIGASLLAGLYPAWKASKQRPVEALRG